MQDTNQENAPSVISTSQVPTRADGSYDWDSPRMRKLLINTVAKGASDEEFALFREICRSTGLNPFKRELWFIKTNSGVQMMTGLHGFHRIANSHPQYDGMEVETEEDEKGKPVKSVAKVYRKDRKLPSVGVARWSEYGKTGGNWNRMPFLMLEKCAESVALRKAFPQELSGLHTSEEMPEQSDSDVMPVSSVNIPEKRAEIRAAKQAEIQEAEDELKDELLAEFEEAEAELAAGVHPAVDDADIADAEFSEVA